MALKIKRVPLNQLMFTTCLRVIQLSKRKSIIVEKISFRIWLLFQILFRLRFRIRFLLHSSCSESESNWMMWIHWSNYKFELSFQSDSVPVLNKIHVQVYVTIPVSIKLSNPIFVPFPVRISEHHRFKCGDK